MVTVLSSSEIFVLLSVCGRRPEKCAIVRWRADSTFSTCAEAHHRRRPTRPAVVVAYTAAVLLLQYSRQNFRNAVRNVQSFLW
jgi:hypothetical protein